MFLPFSKTKSETKYAVIWVHFNCSSIFGTYTIAFKEINQHISFITGILDLFFLKIKQNICKLQTTDKAK
jgi:hypothetical protein